MICILVYSSAYTKRIYISKVRREQNPATAGRKMQIGLKDLILRSILIAAVSDSLAAHRTG